MFLWDRVLGQKPPQSRRSQTDMGIHLDCLVVKVQRLPQHKRTLPNKARWEMSSLELKKNIST